MQNQIKIEIPELHPSLNDWTRWSWPQQHKEKKRWGEMVGWLCKGKGKIEGEVEIHVDYYFPDRRGRDLDNYTPKWICDPIVKAGIIKDDNSNVLKKLSIAILCDKDNPRTEVIITPYAETRQNLS